MFTLRLFWFLVPLVDLLDCFDGVAFESFSDCIQIESQQPGAEFAVRNPAVVDPLIDRSQTDPLFARYVGFHSGFARYGFRR